MGVVKYVLVLKKYNLFMIDVFLDFVKFELILFWYVFIVSIICIFKLKSYFFVECIFIFECGLFECFWFLSIYMNVE